MNEVLLSICIPLYKSIFLKDTLQSIAEQSCDQLEVIIVNDGDNWDYGGVISAFPDLNISYLRQKNAGAGAARNLAFKNAKGKYIKFLDADDLLGSGHLQAQLLQAAHFPHAMISGRWGRFFDNSPATFVLENESIYKNCKGVDWIVESWQSGPNMTQPGIFLIPRQLIAENGLWHEELSRGPCDDLEFFTRLMVNSEIVFCGQAILMYRSGNDASLSGNKSKESFLYYFKTLKMAVAHLLKFREDTQAKKACATQFKILGFKAYPYDREISENAFKEAKMLGGSDYRFPAGGFTKILNNFIGWKNTIWIKGLVGFRKFN
ncbi:hypothetical protein BCY91_12255 [Pelobium manganitolerans]|uniref:Glycosyltransferase 2-like domain-containing protein n=1 Tax=Pelobium manganitolerans TaxID=1842495 RepID=A0A419S1P7_9SPHI|nr:glycosyltransferase family A protein [Pelobium manganitolerans]RKD12416.1 hypothetical protein BCY91_12255 [Pelobium manganitolerans]